MIKQTNRTFLKKMSDFFASAGSGEVLFIELKFKSFAADDFRRHLGDGGTRNNKTSGAVLQNIFFDINSRHNLDELKTFLRQFKDANRCYIQYFPACFKSFPGIEGNLCRQISERPVF